ncbi:hypothetical protein AGMMS50229_18820 [Campylobacterota bacterium]|nr:hypothetical protein AGMMS50229_18820 [Campylobacterota bacterium]
MKTTGGNNAAFEATYKRGKDAFDQGNYEEAIALFTQAIEIDPNNADAYLFRGISYGALGDHPKAIADYTRAIEIDPSDVRAYNKRGESYSELDDYVKEIADWTRVIAIDPGDAKVYRKRAVSYALLGDLKNATKDARKACELGDCALFKLMEENGHICD